KLLHAVKGETGIELAQIHLPKLILLDLNLPDMHGSEVLEKLQRNPETAELPVVVLSADATPSQIERLLTTGARNYLTKPFDIDPFLAVVEDRKSTRLNSSHVAISYAVFCLKKKKNKQDTDYYDSQR